MRWKRKSQGQTQQTKTCKNVLRSRLPFALCPKIVNLGSADRSWNGSSLAPPVHVPVRKVKWAEMK